MASLNDLIVNGVSRFISKIFAKDIEVTGTITGNLTGNVSGKADSADSVDATTFGSMAGKNIPELQEILRTWIGDNIGKNAVAKFSAHLSFTDLWNSGDETTAITEGPTITVQIIGIDGDTNYIHLLFSTYYDKYNYVCSLTNGSWCPIRKLATMDDVPRSASDIGAAADDHTHEGLLSADDRTKLNDALTSVPTADTTTVGGFKIQRLTKSEFESLPDESKTDDTFFVITDE